MSVQVVTDSTCDIPREMAGELGIRIVPIYVRFGNSIYRDGEDIDREEFYHRLKVSPVHPATSQPTPEDFKKIYGEYCHTAEGIVSIHISSRISGTCNSANIARKMLVSRCRIEVIDSKFNSGGLALVAMAAARLARAGKDMETILAETRRAISQVRMYGVFETMKYLARGGRVNRAIVMAASFLKVMPLLTFRDGEIIRAGLVRSLNRGMDKICRFVAGQKDITELVIVHSAIPERAEILKKRLAALFPEEKIETLELGAGLGVHGGPGVLLVALRQGS